MADAPRMSHVWLGSGSYAYSSQVWARLRVLFHGVQLEPAFFLLTITITITEIPVKGNTSIFRYNAHDNSNGNTRENGYAIETEIH
jgi:hypothetical protein